MKVKKIKENNKYEEGMKALVFDVLSEGYKHGHISCNVEIYRMEYKTLGKKSIGFVIQILVEVINKKVK